MFMWYISRYKVNLLKKSFFIIFEGAPDLGMVTFSKPKFNFGMSDFSHQSYLKSNIFLNKGI